MTMVIVMIVVNILAPAKQISPSAVFRALTIGQRLGHRFQGVLLIEL
jgi:hypothetical protein